MNKKHNNKHTSREQLLLRSYFYRNCIAIFVAFIPLSIFFLLIFFLPLIQSKIILFDFKIVLRSIIMFLPAILAFIFSICFLKTKKKLGSYYKKGHKDNRVKELKKYHTVSICFGIPTAILSVLFICLYFTTSNTISSGYFWLALSNLGLIIAGLLTVIMLYCFIKSFLLLKAPSGYRKEYISKNNTKKSHQKEYTDDML